MSQTYFQLKMQANNKLAIALTNSLNDIHEDHTSAFSLRMLLANLVELNSLEDRHEILHARYGLEFTPDRWDLTTQEWLNIINHRLIEYMSEKGISTELSHF